MQVCSISTQVMMCSVIDWRGSLADLTILRMGYFYPCVHQTHIDCLLLKANFVVSSDHRSQSLLKFQSCLITEYA